MEVCKIGMKQSFTKYEKTCEFHFATVMRVCYCGKTDGTCSKMNCPKYNEGNKNGE